MRISAQITASVQDSKKLTRPSHLRGSVAHVSVERAALHFSSLVWNKVRCLLYSGTNASTDLLPPRNSSYKTSECWSASCAAVCSLPMSTSGRSCANTFCCRWRAASKRSLADANSEDLQVPRESWAPGLERSPSWSTIVTLAAGPPDNGYLVSNLSYQCFLCYVALSQVMVALSQLMLYLQTSTDRLRV